jgi:uracil phosphoribosyltransferase
MTSGLAGSLAGVPSVVDRELNDHKFIVPGLGDFGDRLYGTT